MSLLRKKKHSRTGTVPSLTGRHWISSPRHQTHHIGPPLFSTPFYCKLQDSAWSTTTRLPQLKTLPYLQHMHASLGHCNANWQSRLALAMPNIMKNKHIVFICIFLYVPPSTSSSNSSACPSSSTYCFSFFSSRSDSSSWHSLCACSPFSAQSCPPPLTPSCPLILILSPSLLMNILINLLLLLFLRCPLLFIKFVMFILSCFFFIPIHLFHILRMPIICIFLPLFLTPILLNQMLILFLCVLPLLFIKIHHTHSLPRVFLFFCLLRASSLFNFDHCVHLGFLLLIHPLSLAPKLSVGLHGIRWPGWLWLATQRVHDHALPIWPFLWFQTYFMHSASVNLHPFS